MFVFFWLGCALNSAPSEDTPKEPKTTSFISDPVPEGIDTPTSGMSGRISAAFGAVEIRCPLMPIAHFNAPNPCVLQGHFDGDNTLDTAVMVIDIPTEKYGVAILAGNGENHAFGAGSPIGNGGDDLDWVDIWALAPFPKAVKVTGSRPTHALHLEKSESASGLVYWDGKTFVWLQQGD